MMDEKIIFSHKKSIDVRSRAFALSNKKPRFCFHLVTTDKDITLYVKMFTTFRSIYSFIFNTMLVFKLFLLPRSQLPTDFL